MDIKIGLRESQYTAILFLFARFFACIGVPNNRITSFLSCLDIPDITRRISFYTAWLIATIECINIYIRYSLIIIYDLCNSLVYRKGLYKEGLTRLNTIARVISIIFSIIRPLFCRESLRDETQSADQSKS